MFMNRGVAIMCLIGGICTAYGEAVPAADAGNFSRDFTVGAKYLVIPVANGAKECRLTLKVDGKAVRSYDVALAEGPDHVDWWAFFTLSRYKGQPASVSVGNATAEAFALIQQADEVPGSDRWYTERLRPQFHFSQKVGWNNDVNGTVYYDGEWHLFFQHNPVGIKWGNMTWGHAVSRDLVHWEQLPNAVFPRTMAQGVCFSGSGVVDKRNTAGFKTAAEDVIVLIVTDRRRREMGGESLAYSNDRGRTFTWYQDNPVLPHKGNDPKVIWYAYDADDTPLSDAARRLGGHWVMVVLDYGRHVTPFYTSTDLKNWTEQSFLRGYGECPELFELPVDGEQSNKRWVIMGGDATYTIGQFDGRLFTPEHKGKHRVHYGAYYASQLFNNPPEGRRIQMGWAKIEMPGMPFNQTFTFPHHLTLRTTGDGVRLFAEPVKEIAKLRKKTHTAANKKLAEDEPMEVATSGQLFDIRATFDLGSAKQVGLEIGGQRVAYNAITGRLRDAPLKPISGRVALQVLVDRPIIEIVGNAGRVYLTHPREPSEVSSVRAFAEGGTATLVDLTIHELTSIWNAKVAESTSP